LISDSPSPAPRLPTFVFPPAPVAGEGQFEFVVQEDAESSGDERSESRMEEERQEALRALEENSGGVSSHYQWLLLILDC
jgi:hypothetical protein